MKIFSQIDSLSDKETHSVQVPVKVCMHVLGRAPMDNRVIREATTLLKAGCAVSIVDIEAKGNQLVEDIDGIIMKHIIVPDSFITSTYRWSFIRVAQMLIRGTLILLRTSADIYHAHDEAALPACYIAALLRRKLLVFDAHEFPLNQWPSSEVSRGRRRLQKFLTILLRIMMPRCARVITVSPPIAQEMRKRYPSTEVSLIRNVPVYRAVPKSNRLRQLLHLTSDVRIALYQGLLWSNRSLDKLIRAARFLGQNVVIVMMGSGPQETLSQLEILIASEKVADRVKIIPAVPYDELLDWTSSADIGLAVFSPDYSPSIRLCLPNKLFEYLMAGLPILTSQLDAVVDVINTYDVGRIVPSLEPQDIAAAINRMLDDHVALERMRRNALEAAQYDLCWEKESQQLVHLYHEILTM